LFRVICIEYRIENAEVSVVIIRAGGACWLLEDWGNSQHHPRRRRACGPTEGSYLADGKGCDALAQIAEVLRTDRKVLAYSRLLFFQINPRFQRFDWKVFLSDALRYMGGVVERVMIDNTHVVGAARHGAGNDSGSWNGRVGGPADAPSAGRVGEIPVASSPAGSLCPKPGLVFRGDGGSVPGNLVGSMR
jgi:hypothetical protein